MLRLTAGQPFFTQAICFHIVENLNDKKQTKVTVTDVDTACRDLVENAPYHFSYIWSELSSDEKIVIALLAETLISEESYAVIDDIISKLPKYDLQYSRNDIGKALAQLQEEDLLEKKSDSELYRFRMELTHAWIQTEHPTWGVLREVQENQ